MDHGFLFPALSHYLVGTQDVIRYSLLDIVQKTASSMDSDEVNTISGTTESLQIAQCAEIVYNDLIVTSDLPEQFQLFSLTPSLDVTAPIVMYRPENIESIQWIKYQRTIQDDTTGQLWWTKMQGIGIEEYLKRQDGLSLDDSNISQMNLVLPNTTLQVLYYNDRSPDWYTSFDDNTILFSSIDTAVDSTLQSLKTLCYGEFSTTFIMVDGFIPAFDSDVHQIWLHETKALASAEIRQVTNAKAEKAARKGWIKLQDGKPGINTGSYYNQYPNYGRTTSATQRPRIFRND